MLRLRYDFPLLPSVVYFAVYTLLCLSVSLYFAADVPIILEGTA